MVDSGATHNFVGKSTVLRLGAKLQSADCLPVTLADGSLVEVREVCELLVNFSPEYSCKVSCYVLPKLSSEVVLGMAWLRAANPVVDWSNYELVLTMEQGKRVVLDGIPRTTSLPTVAQCTVKVGLKAIRAGADAWFMMVRPLAEASPQGVDSP